MSSHYYEPHSSREHRERRRESPHRLRVDSHTTSHHHKHRDHTRSSSRHRDDRYDTRPHRQRPASPDDRHREAYPARSLRRQRSWPPQPFAEDERTSLRREAGGILRLRESRSREVPSRGSIDQEPIIVDLRPPPPEPVRKGKDSKGYRRESERPPIPTPPTSEDERARRTQRRPSRLTTDIADPVPELSSRRSSPYSYTKQTGPSHDILTTERVMSPETMTPPAEFGRRSDHRPNPIPRPPSPRRDSPRTSGPKRDKDSQSSRHTHDESAIDDTFGDSSDYRNRRRDNNLIHRESFSSNGPSRATPASIERERARKSDFDSRRDTPTELPNRSRQDFDNFRRPPPLTSSQSFHESSPSTFIRPTLMPSSTDLAARSRESSFSRSRPASPASLKDQTGATPPRSPRVSVEMPVAGAMLDAWSGSANTSQTSSPTMHTLNSPRIPNFEHDWSPLQSAVGPRRARMPASRLGAEVLRDDSPEVGRRDHAPAQPQALPYPVDDIMATAWMPSMPPLPSESEQHQWRAPDGYDSWPSGTSTADYNQLTRVESMPSTPLYPPPRPLPQDAGAEARPSLQRMYSTASDAPPEQRSHYGQSRYADSKREPSSGFNRKLEDLARAVKANPPHCPGLYLDDDFEDWRTVRSMPSIHFCPDCIRPMRGTVFENHLRRFQPPSRNTRVYCAFELPWMVRAWQYTLHDQCPDFSILRSVAETDNCRSALRGEPLRDAKGILHPDGDANNHTGNGSGSSNSSVNGAASISAATFVPGFQICDADYRKIKLLLPRVATLFVDKPNSSGSGSSSDAVHRCSIETSSGAFRSYWDALEAINSRSKGSRGGVPDPAPLLEAIARKRRSRERNGRY